MARWTWPARTRWTFGARRRMSSSSARVGLSRPIASIARIPVTSGGWCIASTRRRLAVVRERGREPAHPLRAQPAAVLPRHGGVAHHQPQPADGVTYCTKPDGPRRRPGSSAARSASRSSWFPGRTWTGIAKRRQQLADALVLGRVRPFWTRSPVATTASGAGSSAASAATTAVSLRAGSPSPGADADVQVGDLGEQGAAVGGHRRWERTLGRAAARHLAFAARANWVVGRLAQLASRSDVNWWRAALSATKTVGAPRATNGSVKSGSRSASSPRPEGGQVGGGGGAVGEHGLRPAGRCARPGRSGGPAARRRSRG